MWIIPLVPITLLMKSLVTLKTRSTQVTKDLSLYICVRIYSIGACTESDYRAQIPNATQTAVTGLKWFKIWEDGFDANNSTWGVDRLIANKGKHTFTIPSCIASGNYLVRTEIIGEEASTV